jgi:hypothetical protein
VLTVALKSYLPPVRKKRTDGVPIHFWDGKEELVRMGHRPRSVGERSTEDYLDSSVQLLDGRS